VRAVSPDDAHPTVEEFAMRLVPVLVAVLPIVGLAGVAGAAPLHLSHCSVGVESTRVAAEFTAQVGRPKNGVTLDFVTAASPAAQPTSTVTVKQGPNTLLTLDSSAGAGGLTIDLGTGVGFSGVQSADVASSDGVTFSGAVDGRAVVPFQTAGLETLVFADGQSAPAVKLKGSVKAALRRLTKQTLKSTCLGDPLDGTGAGVLPACALCNIACLGPQWRCALDALAALPKCKGKGTGLVCVTRLETSEYDCASTATQCADACFNGSACAAATTAVARTP
jgi:hypothetical protein